MKTEVHLNFVKIVKIHLVLSNINTSMYTHMETVSEKLRFIHSCQTQIQERDIILSPEIILKHIEALPAALCLP